MTKLGNTFSRNVVGAASAALILGSLGLSAGAAHAVPIIPGGGADSSSESTASAVSTTTAAEPTSDADSSSAIPSDGAESSGSGTAITSTTTATTTTTPDAADNTAEPGDTDSSVESEATPAPYADAPGTDVTAQPEDLAVTGSPTQNIVIALSVMGLIAAGGYAFALHRGTV